MNLPVQKIAQHATVRLIPSAYHKPPVLRALAANAEEEAALAAIEGLTNKRLRAQRDGLPDLDPRELAFRARAHQLQQYGTTYVNSAFIYTRPGGNRFNDENRGAWYCAFDDLTAISEVAFHKTRELQNVSYFYDEMPYQAFLADFIGDFPDLRGVTPPPPCLDPDSTLGYPAGQTLARRLREEGHSGLVYPSVRQPGGVCLVAFEPQAVQNVRPGAKWLLSWSGSPDYTVTTA